MERCWRGRTRSRSTGCTRDTSLSRSTSVPGLPGFAIVGLADAAVREARERVTAAIINSGFEFPARRITANLAPGDVRKAGPGLDLALACAVLAASGQLPPRGARARGAVRRAGARRRRARLSRGALAVAQAAQRAGMRALVLAPACAREAPLIDGLEVIAVAAAAQRRAGAERRSPATRCAEPRPRWRREPPAAPQTSDREI